MLKFKEILINKISGLINKLNTTSNEEVLLAVGAMLSNQQLILDSKNINDYEFKIFSQFWEDGIIQFLIKNVRIENKLFIEFGVENYLESNTRFLMMNNNWVGFVMDGSEKAIESLKKQSWYWKYNLTGKAIFIDKENINNLLAKTNFSNIGLLSIDIDGNDYHIFKEIDLSKINPSIIVLEYNSVFGKERAIAVPYKKDFDRTKAHYSNLFFGASLAALNYLANKKGYSLVGSNITGTNAFFVRNDLLNERVKELSVDEAYKESQIRESRDKNYALTYLSGKERIKLIKGLEVINVIDGTIEKL